MLHLVLSHKMIIILLLFHVSQDAIAELGASGHYDTEDDFTVVVQPFMIGVEVPMVSNSTGCIAVFNCALLHRCQIIKWTCHILLQTASTSAQRVTRREL